MGALNRAVVKGGRDPMCQHGRVTTEHLKWKRQPLGLERSLPQITLVQDVNCLVSRRSPSSTSAGCWPRA
jgi:hypothetical protein